MCFLGYGFAVPSKSTVDKAVHARSPCGEKCSVLEKLTVHEYCYATLVLDEAENFDCLLDALNFCNQFLLGADGVNVGVECVCHFSFLFFGGYLLCPIYI